MDLDPSVSNFLLYHGPARAATAAGLFGADVVAWVGEEESSSSREAGRGESSLILDSWSSLPILYRALISFGFVDV